MFDDEASVRCVHCRREMPFGESRLLDGHDVCEQCDDAMRAEDDEAEELEQWRRESSGLWEDDEWQTHTGEI